MIRRQSTPIHIERKQIWVVGVAWIEKVWDLIVDALICATRSGAAISKWKICAFLTVPNITANPEIQPIKSQPPVTLIKGAPVQSLCLLLRAEVLNLLMGKNVSCF
jgi:hypothetical protein